MTGEKIVIKSEEIQAPKQRMTAEDYGFLGSPVTQVIPSKKGKGHKYNRAKQKKKNNREMCI